MAGSPSGDPGLPVYRLGDQAAVIPSFTGDGMAMALCSARRAAAAILAGQPAGEFQRKLSASFRGPVRLAGLVATLAKAPAAQQALAAAGQVAPWLLGRIAAGTRLGASA